MADETTTTTADDVIPTEEIVDFVRAYPRATPVSMSVAWIKQSTGIVPCLFPRLSTSAVIPAGTKTEAASFTRVATSTGSDTTTAAFVGSELALTDELVMSSKVRGLPATVIIDRLRAMANRIDTDVLANFDGLSSTSGDTGTDLTRAGMGLALAAYWALNLDDSMGEHAALLANSAASQLMQDNLTTTAVAGHTERFGVGVSLGEFQGLVLLRAANAAAISGGYASGITPIGNERSGLLLGISEAINARPPQRGSEGERDAEEYVVVRAMYGTGVTDSHALELITP